MDSAGGNGGLNEAAERARVVEVARSFIGTPYHDCARVKGPKGGVDCATLLLMVYKEAGFVAAEADIPKYAPDHFLHSPVEVYLQQVERFAHEMPAGCTPGPGDIVLYRLKFATCFAKSFSHGAIIVDWPSRVIHAFKRARMVIETQAFEAELAGAETKFFTRW